MAQPIKDSFLDLERHRQLLEENIEKLRKTLRHWQMWEAEYEGLKEEILSVKPTPDLDHLVAISQTYEGELVTKKEIEDILGLKTSRTSEQVINILDRRMDYVQQNVRTIEKQIATFEDKLTAATIISTPEVRNEEGLPITEIQEELDNDDNIISSKLSTPGSAKPQLLEVLEKAGITDLPEIEVKSVGSSMATQEPPPTPDDTSSSRMIPVLEQNAASKKNVMFADNPESAPQIQAQTQNSKQAKRVQEIMSRAKQDEVPTEAPVIPVDESPEDAALRRQMLQYGMSEIGAVVAELDVEDGSDWSEEDYDDEDSSDEEDEYGRSTGRVVDDELRRQMIALEERLGLRMMENIGNKASHYDVVEEGIGRVTINGQEETPSSKSVAEQTNDTIKQAKENEPPKSVNKPAKKSVKFSDELDISPAPEPPVVTPKILKMAPVSDIVERSAPKEVTSLAPQKKASRFKTSRTAPTTKADTPNPISSTKPKSPLPLYPATPTTPKPYSTPIEFTPATNTTKTIPTGPEGKVVAPSIIERDVPLNIEVPEPDAFDPQLLNQEVATEYHKMRNRMIARQGGFMKEDESEIVPFTEEEGGPKRVSRFKAARLARS